MFLSESQNCVSDLYQFLSLFENSFLKQFECQPYDLASIDLLNKLINNEGEIIEMQRRMTIPEEPSKDCLSLDLQTKNQQAVEELKNDSFDASTKNESCSAEGDSKKRVNFRTDSMRKRLKAVVNNYIINRLNQTIKHEKSQYYFFNLPSYFSNNLNLQVNKEMHCMTIREICALTNPRFGEKDMIRIRHNVKMMNTISNIELQDILSKTWKEMFEEYISTDEYSKYLNCTLKKEGQAYLTRFRSQVESFIFISKKRSKVKS